MRGDTRQVPVAVDATAAIAELRLAEELGRSDFELRLMYSVRPFSSVS